MFVDLKPKIADALLEAHKDGRANQHQLQQVVRRTVGRFASSKLRRRPMIIPVVVEA